MIKFNDSELNRGIDEFDVKLQAALGMYCETAAKKLETKAKVERPWTDRTGDARKRLVGTSEMEGTRGHIVLAQGVEYGIWLELAHEKQYAIVEPTIRQSGNEVLTGLEHFIERLSHGCISMGHRAESTDRQ